MKLPIHLSIHTAELILAVCKHAHHVSIVEEREVFRVILELLDSLVDSLAHEDTWWEVQRLERPQYSMLDIYKTERLSSLVERESATVERQTLVGSGQVNPIVFLENLAFCKRTAHQG